MKKLSYSNKMRWIAGGLYGLLAVYQMFLGRPVVQQVPLANMPFTLFYNIVLFVSAAAVCVWMFRGREALCGGARRAVVAVTFFFVVFELMTYSDQTNVINITLYSLFPSLVDNTVALYALMVLRLLVLIFAAFLVVGTARDKAPEAADGEALEDGEERLKIVELMEEIVLVEPEEKPEEKPEKNMPENAGEAADEKEEKKEENTEKPAENAEA